jgi:hypothetical protein
MNLQELITGHALRPAPGLPDWMLGWFKRHSISFADGLTDVDTHVCWLQSRNFTIDLRLPRLALRGRDPAPLGRFRRLGRARHLGWPAPELARARRLAAMARTLA